MLNLYKKFPIPCLRQLSKRCLANSTKSHDSILKNRVEEEIAKDKQLLKWRKSNEELGAIDTKLKLFENQEQTSDYLVMMQKPINLNPKDWLAKWENKKEKKERYMQQFVPERHDTLGPDLATAHFILYRKGAVKFLNSQNWMKANKDGEFNLPSTYQPQYKVEAVKCDNMELYYEGLENIRWLQELKFLSFRNVKTFDDWCLDRVSGSHCHKLEILDISGTKCTARGLPCLYRLSSLKLLVVDDPKFTLEYELSCSMLEEALPELRIVTTEAFHD